MSIKNDCKRVFQLDELDFFLLGQIARRGEMFKKNIKLGRISDRQTSRRIDSLIERGFLKILEAEIYRNMDDKLIKKIGLTFKGCIASLVVEKIQNNYLVKKYLDSIKNINEKQNILSYIQKDVELFLIINRSIGITLDNMTDIIGWFEEYEKLKSISKKDIEEIEKLGKEKKDMEKEIDLNFKDLFHTIKNSLMIDYSRWYEILDMFSNQYSTKEIAKELIGELSEGEKGFYDPKERARRFAEFEKQIMESPRQRRYFEELKKMEGKNFQEKFHKELTKQRKKLGLG